MPRNVRIVPDGATRPAYANPSVWVLTVAGIAGIIVGLIFGERIAVVIGLAAAIGCWVFPDSFGSSNK